MLRDGIGMNRVGASAWGVIAVVAAVLSACGDGTTEPEPPPNRAPEASSSISPRTVTAGQTTTVNVGSAFRDPDGNPLTYAAATSNPGVAAASMNGTVVTVSGVAPGTATITVTATDPGGLSAAQSFTVTVERPNRAPVSVDGWPDGHVGVDTIWLGTRVSVPGSDLFMDPDGDPLRLEASSADPTIVRAGTESGGANIVLEAVGVGTTRVTVRATDPGGLSITVYSESTVLQPNRAPEATGSINARTVRPGEEFRLDVAPFFTDPDGDTLTYGVSHTGAGVERTGLARSTLTVVAGPQGSGTVTVRATDPDGEFAEQSFDLTVRNRAPVATAALGALELTPGQTRSIDLAQYFSDPDGDPLRYAASSSAAARATATVAGSRLTVRGVAQGTATITVTATDDPGGLSVSQSFTVTVGRPNRPPQRSGSIPDRTVSVGRAIKVNAAQYFNDPDGDSLTYASSSSAAATALVVVSGSEVTVTALRQGRATITVTATDPGGLSVSQSFTVTVEDSADRAALEALYRATDGRNWTNNTNWLTDAPLGDWYGVTANQTTGGVVKIDLRGNNLRGRIPPEIGSLGNLDYLNLNGNQLTGPIPSRLGNLGELRILYLTGNQLTGPIPPHLGNLGELRFLYLSGNQLTGPIPPEFGGLDNLEHLNLGYNQLTGPIPPEIGHLDNLVLLGLSNNHLSGPIPPEFGGLVALSDWAVSFNPALSGPLPQSLTSLTRLDRLDARGTGLCAPQNATFQTWMQSVRNNVRACAATLQLVSGGGQQANPGARLPNPVVVRAVDAAGAAVSGATVTFTPASGQGTANPGEATTDSQGRAQTMWTLGAATGTQTLTAAADGVSLRITAAVGAADDHSCARGQETRLSRGDSISGELTVGDEDCFTVVVPGNAMATQLAAWTTGDTDTYGYIYDSGYNQLAENDDFGGSANFWAVADPALPGTYHIKVRGYDRATTVGGYRIFVDDHGNSPATATDDYTYPRADSATVAGDLSVPYNVDYFYVGNLTVPLTVGFATTGSTDTYGVLYDGQGSEVASSDDDGTGTNFHFIHQLEVGVEYYVRVTGFRNATGPYLLHLWLPQASAGVTRLTNNPGSDDSPEWSPSGARIAFNSRRDGNTDIYTMNSDGSGSTRVTYALDHDDMPAWFGNRIAFRSSLPGTHPEVYLMSADGSGLTNLTNHAHADGGPAWSPDGARIAFYSARNGGIRNIYVMNADGRGVTQLTSEPAHDDDPAWSPDGARIAFASERDDPFRSSEIYLMNADGSGVTRLTNNASAWDYYPAWSPDGRRIAFTSDRGGNHEIYVMNADGRGVTNLTNHSAADGNPAWSPDGRRIAFTSNRDGNWEIYVMNVPARGSAAASLHRLVRPKPERPALTMKSRRP